MQNLRHGRPHSPAAQVRTKSVDLLDLDATTSIPDVVSELIAREPLITENQRKQFTTLMQRLQVGVPPRRRVPV